MLNCSKLTFVTANKAKNTEFYEKMYHFYYDPFDGAVFMRWRSEVVHLIFPPHIFPSNLLGTEDLTWMVSGA